ncbi:unnamed protein product [Knipowitschia caucasica]
MNLRQFSLWFGSFTNLSFRRSGRSSVSDEDKPEETAVVDNLEATRPQTSSYVRSSNGYSHMGTLPRQLWKKRHKSYTESPNSNKMTKDNCSPDPCPEKSTNRPSTETPRAEEERPAEKPGADPQHNLNTPTEDSARMKPTDLQQATSEAVSETCAPPRGCSADVQPHTCTINDEEDKKELDVKISIAASNICGVKNRTAIEQSCQEERYASSMESRECQPEYVTVSTLCLFD